MPMSRIGPKGQVVLPKTVRDALRVAPGDRVVFSVEGGRAVITPVRARTAADLRGILRVGRSIDAKEARRAYQDHLADKFGAGKAHDANRPR